MRITYTAEDGTTWDSEAQCLGWERFCLLLRAAERADDELSDFCDQFGDWCIDAAGEEDCCMKYLFKNRSKLFQLTDLMRKAMLLG